MVRYAYACPYSYWTMKNVQLYVGDHKYEVGTIDYSFDRPIEDQYVEELDTKRMWPFAYKRPIHCMHMCGIPENHSSHKVSLLLHTAWSVRNQLGLILLSRNLLIVSLSFHRVV